MNSGDSMDPVYLILNQTVYQQQCITKYYAIFWSYKPMVSEAYLNAWYMSYNKINDFYDQPIKACKGH